jgi:hypothetical protein
MRRGIGRNLQPLLFEVEKPDIHDKRHDGHHRRQEKSKDKSNRPTPIGQSRRSRPITHHRHPFAKAAIAAVHLTQKTIRASIATGLTWQSNGRCLTNLCDPGLHFNGPLKYRTNTVVFSPILQIRTLQIRGTTKALRSCRRSGPGQIRT